MVKLYGINHPLIKREYPVVYNVFGADRQRVSKASPSLTNAGSIPASSTIHFKGQGFKQFQEARQQLKHKLLDTA